MPRQTVADPTFRPLDRWPGDPTPADARQRSPFSASYTNTLATLKAELAHLEARDVVLLLDVSAAEIRRDGYLSVRARPKSPGVVVAFDSKFGPLKYACDTFTDWTANLRAIALGLEKLRAVDRYGISKRGEQYRGWNALPPGRPADAAVMTAEAAARILAPYAHVGPGALLEDADIVAAAYRRAARLEHPDRPGGNAERFRRVTEARDVLNLHHRGAA